MTLLTATAAPQAPWSLVLTVAGVLIVLIVLASLNGRRWKP